MKRLPLSVVLFILEVAFLVARWLAAALASDSDGGRKITKAERADLLHQIEHRLLPHTADE